MYFVTETERGSQDHIITKLKLHLPVKDTTHRRYSSGGRQRVLTIFALDCGDDKKGSCDVLYRVGHNYV